MRKVKIAVVGCGDVARHVYLPELSRFADRAELTAVCDREQERALDAAERFGARTFYTDLDRLLQDSDAELIVNLTPHRAHAAVSLAALRAGRHVHTEKPLALSLEEASELIETARARGLKLGCAPVTVLLPSFRRWRQLLEEGAVGRVTFVRAQTLGPPVWGGFPPEHVWYFAAGSGPLMDVGVYELTALTGLFGPARRVSAMGGTILPERTIPDGPRAGERFRTEAEDSMHLHLEFDGFFAALDASWCVQATRNQPFEVYGERGTLSGNPVYANTPIHLFRPEHGWREEEPDERLPRPDDWIQGVAHLVDCVLEGEGPRNSGAHACHVLEIMLAALRSAREGQAVTLSTSF